VRNTILVEQYNRPLYSLLVDNRQSSGLVSHPNQTYKDLLAVRGLTWFGKKFLNARVAVTMAKRLIV
jgi:hypothetical protein